MRDIAGNPPITHDAFETSAAATDAAAGGPASPESDSNFVHHRRIQRFLGRDTAYTRRPYGRI
jgi:hypothetical protein